MISGGGGALPSFSPGLSTSIAEGTWVPQLYFKISSTVFSHYYGHTFCVTMLFLFSGSTVTVTN